MNDEPFDPWAPGEWRKPRIISVAAHKRRCAIRLGVRESYEVECNCRDHWDHVNRWCSRCGRTLKDLHLP